MGVADRFFSSSAAQVGMYHLAYDRPGPDDGYFDHQIIEAFRFEAGQSSHLARLST